MHPEIHPFLLDILPYSNITFQSTLNDPQDNIGIFCDMLFFIPTLLMWFSLVVSLAKVCQFSFSKKTILYYSEYVRLTVFLSTYWFGVWFVHAFLSPSGYIMRLFTLDLPDFFIEALRAIKWLLETHFVIP
jgi:hypothetical protein